MADKTTPAPEPDMISQVGAMLARVARGEYTCDVGIGIDIGDEADNAILLASAILAVAAELREIGNELSDLNRHARTGGN